MTSPIAQISDTASWVAMYRALETDRPDALFRDPYARRLGGPRGEEILRSMPKALQFAWPMIVRTTVMDEIILRVVAEEGVDTVLNLAAGLDARPYRLPLPASLTWLDADLPPLLDYKEAQLAGDHPVCRLELLRVDLTNAAARRVALAQAGAGAGTGLAITEGLLVYLTPGEVAALARDLYAEPAFRFWLIDLGSPRLLRMLERSWGKALETGSAPMRFAPAEGTAFFAPLGWHEVEFRSTFEESIRLGRTIRFARLFGLLARLYPRRKQEEMRRMSGIVLLERAKPAPGAE
jgi:methyltransferase (TIGR00027 family)